MTRPAASRRLAAVRRAEVRAFTLLRPSQRFPAVSLLLEGRNLERNLKRLLRRL